jgi:hypothetical protein
MKWLSPDSGFMRGLADLADAVWINIMTMIVSIPVVTIGAALTSAHDAARRSLAGEGHATSNYFRAFRQNFAQATILWFWFGVTGAGLLGSWVFLQITPLLIPKFALTIVWLVGFEWVWALQARFSNMIGATLKNAFVFGFSYFGTTLALVVLDVLFAGLLIASWFYMPQGLFLLMVLGYGSMIMVHIPIVERVFKKYVHAPVR